MAKEDAALKDVSKTELAEAYSKLKSRTKNAQIRNQCLSDFCRRIYRMSRRMVQSIKAIRWLIYFILVGFNAFLCGVLLMSALKASDVLHALGYVAAGFLSGYACYLVWKNPPDKVAP